MQTFQTIQEAFKNGTGDVFFSKDGRYVSRSRHIDNLVHKMELEGFKFIPYKRVIELSTEEKSKDSEIIINNQEMNNRSVISIDLVSNGYDGYYDEFPDAYGQ